MTSIVPNQKLIGDKLIVFFFRLYHTIIKPTESYVVVNKKISDLIFFLCFVMIS